MEKKTIGSFIAVLRKASGLTQRELAEKLNVSDKAVSRWERDESAPDLSLIPVIADIFGITSDELLRGQRATEGSGTVQNPAKSEKQIQNILSRSLTRYKIYCLISGTVAITGLLAVMILNLGLLMAYVGFFVGCIFFIAAAICQTSFLILSRNAVTASDIPEAHTASAEKALLLGAELVFGLIFLLFSVCLPLIILPVGTFRGLTAISWLEYGSVFGALAAALWLTGCLVVNRRTGYWERIDWKSPHNLLRLQWLRKGALILLAVLALHLGTTALLTQNYHLLVRGRAFDNWNDFRRYMEMPTDTDGTALSFLSVEGTGENTRFIYENQSGDPVVFHKKTITQKLYATPEDEESGSEPLVSYRHLNKQISSIRLNRGGLPVQVFTQLQMLAVKIIALCVHLLWCAVYFMISRRLLRGYRQAVKENLR